MPLAQLPFSLHEAHPSLMSTCLCLGICKIWLSPMQDVWSSISYAEDLTPSTTLSPASSSEVRWVSAFPGPDITTSAVISHPPHSSSCSSTALVILCRGWSCSYPKHHTAYVLSPLDNTMGILEFYALVKHILLTPFSRRFCIAKFFPEHPVTLFLGKGK